MRAKARSHISLGVTMLDTMGALSSLVYVTRLTDGTNNRYSYSLVFAADMYQTVFKEDPLDPARGDRYRKSILIPGGSREDLDSLEEMLGRPPNSDAFMKELFGSESRV